MSIIILDYKGVKVTREWKDNMSLGAITWIEHMLDDATIDLINGDDILEYNSQYLWSQKKDWVKQFSMCLHV